MDMLSWKKVLQNWVLQCNITDRNNFNIEQSDIDVFYQNFRLQHAKIKTDKYKDLSDFLKAFYSAFDTIFDDKNCLSSADYVYVYSILLHFCCVKHPEKTFHGICQRLPDFDQKCIERFFKELLNTETITREGLRHAIDEVVNMSVSPPRRNESFSSVNNVIFGVTNSLSIFRCDSPLKTSGCSSGSQRVTPPTPKTHLLEERTRELYNLRAELETERYEKSILETQIIENENELQKINNDHKVLLQHLQDLKNDLFAKANDGYVNPEEEDYKVQKRLLKELSQKECDVIQLSNNVFTLREEKDLAKKKLYDAEKQMIVYTNRIEEMESKYDLLTEELKQKNETIKYLNDNKLELEQFIINTRSSSLVPNRDLNSTADCLETSFWRSNSSCTDSNSLSPENLGVSVVDVQLREKEHENQLLKDELKNIQHEHECLEKRLVKLTEEFDLPSDSITKNEEQSDEENCGDNEVNFREQFNIFNKCVDKIDLFLKTKQNEIKVIQEQSIQLQSENEKFEKKLNELQEEIDVLKEKLAAKEKRHQEIEKSKEQMELVLRTYKESEETLMVQIRLLEKTMCNKTLHWNEQLKNLNTKLTKQVADIGVYSKTEGSYKSIYKQILIQKARLKKEARRADTYICDLKNKLKEKESQLFLLDKEVAELKQKNEILEENLSCLIKEHKQEILTSANFQRELERQMAKFKDQLNEIELLMHSKEDEYELKVRPLEELKICLRTIRKLFIDSNINDDNNILNDINEIKSYIERLLKSNDDLTGKVADLREKNRDVLTAIEELTHELEKKYVECQKNKEEVVKSKVGDLNSKKKIEQIEHKQVRELNQVKNDLKEKEQELQDLLKEACLEYETSMERIAVELKLEKEQHNNKEMELILCKADYSEAKKKLIIVEKEMQKLSEENERLHQNCRRLQKCESMIEKCSEVKDTEAFNQETEQNTSAFLEADKALESCSKIAREPNATKNELVVLQNVLKEKGRPLIEMEFKLNEKPSNIQNDVANYLFSSNQSKLDKLYTYTECSIKDNEEKEPQVLKRTLLTPLKEKTDQLKETIEEKEQTLHNIKEDFHSLSLQNTKIQADLIKRKNEICLSFEELQQKNEDLEQKLSNQMKELHKKSEQLESTIMSVVDIIGIMESNFFSQELIQLNVYNAFNYTEEGNDKNIQKLRKYLNYVLCSHQKLNEEVEKCTVQKENAITSLTLLKDVNNKLLARLSEQGQLENDKLIMGKNLLLEIRRLEEDLSNVEKVNERLANENVNLQFVLDNAEKEVKDLKSKINYMENEALELKEKCKQFEKLSEEFKYVDLKLKDKSNKLEILEIEYQKAKDEGHKIQRKLLEKLQAHEKKEAENKKTNEKLKILKAVTDEASTNKELLTTENKELELSQKCEELEQQLNTTSKKQDEVKSKNLNTELTSDQQEDNAYLNQEIKSLRLNKEFLRENAYGSKKKNSSIGWEKNEVLEKNILLCKQVDETAKNETLSEAKVKYAKVKSQDFERKSLIAENELKCLKIELEKSECCCRKLQAENKSLQDNYETSSKRVEKLALKLGDSQAKSSKLQRDNEKLCKNLESYATKVEALQKEKDLLHIEAKSLKERLSRAERMYEQLTAKMQNLEVLNNSLQQMKQKLEASEKDSKTKLNKLEKIRDVNEEKLRQLRNSLNNIENDNVKLNLEIGSLNCQLNEIKVEHSKEESQQCVELNHKLTEAQELNQKYEKINEKLKTDLNSLKEENSSLSDRLCKTALSLDIALRKSDDVAAEIEQVRSEMLIIKQEKTQMDQQLEASIEKINQYESQNRKTVCESKNRLNALEQKITDLEIELAAKTKKIIDLENETIILKEKPECQNCISHLSELKDFRGKLSLAEDIRLKEKEEIISQLRLDNRILHSKYHESKQRVLDAVKSSEEQIKENRLELEGKLEKMKSKMKTLYTEEVTKMKMKQDRETALLKSEIEALKAEKSKYEEHTRKLSNQIVRLNDNILKHQKENAILSTKLKHIMKQLQENECSKRSSSIHVSTISSSTASLPGSNLAMEDEEGEVFNNTYLTDMKNGCVTELMGRDVCIEELQYRNSMLPPHLRSTYAAQFDHEFSEDDLKDGPPIFDDSMSALLSTTTGGIRKKCSGVTHYKRPGPPTPSKNGGRLSFGGSSAAAREILKEPCDGNAESAVGPSKTPARFNFFISRFSMGNTKDETPNNKRETSKFMEQRRLRKAKIKINKIFGGLLIGIGCTSTPRNSGIHFRQPSLLDQLISSTPFGSSLSIDNEIVKIESNLTSPDISIIEPPKTTLGMCEVPNARKPKIIVERLEAIARGLKRGRRKYSMFGSRMYLRISDICKRKTSFLSSPAIYNIKTLRSQPKEDGDDKTIKKEKTKSYHLKNINYGEFVKNETLVIENCLFKNQESSGDGITSAQGKFGCSYNDIYESEKEYSSVYGQDEDEYAFLIKGEKNTEIQNEEHSYQGNIPHLLEDNESNTSFKFKRHRSSCSQYSSLSNCSHTFPQSQIYSQKNQSHSTVPITPVELSPDNTNSHLSRTIYGSNVIYNHRLPNISTTYTCKSSIYVKNGERSPNESSGYNDIVLNSNQTITLIDIIRMWSQMDSLTRIIVSFAILASFITFFGCFVSLYARK